MFKKTLAAVAVGMVVFGAQAAEFTAADGTVFQVNFEALAETVDTVSTAGATTTTFKGDGQIQLKATKKVNDDLNVFGQVEVDFDPVVDNAAAAYRRACVRFCVLAVRLGNLVSFHMTLRPTVLKRPPCTTEISSLSKLTPNCGQPFSLKTPVKSTTLN